MQAEHISRCLSVAARGAPTSNWKVDTCSPPRIDHPTNASTVGYWRDRVAKERACADKTGNYLAYYGSDEYNMVMAEKMAREEAEKTKGTGKHKPKAGPKHGGDEAKPQPHKHDKEHGSPH